MDLKNINIILATDCGSTTSKARLFMKRNGEYRFTASGEAPTTVETPFEDVTLGVRNAVREIEELMNHKLLDEHGVITPSKGEKEGVDLYVTTSSAGGGLQMAVAGVIQAITAESAERAALGAGAIVMEVLSVDDGRANYERIRRIRTLRPDMILIAGGTDGGTVKHVVRISQIISSADPKARLGLDYQLPIVYAGNKNAREHVKKLFNDNFALKIVDNIRPVLEVENPGPSRDAVHELFMEHVMSHAPGYDNLMTWTHVPIMPTPAGEGRMFRTIADTYKENVIGVGLGGATTNIYSIYNTKFVRTVSANLGMSYSICNVLKETGIDNIMRWIPFDIDRVDVENKLRNKMIRPTTIPLTLKSLLIEHAVAREALRLGFQHHKFLARPLRGVRRERELADIFDQKTFEETYIDMLKVDWIGGTGGLLSHAPRRAQSALMLMDGFLPEGITKLAQDSVFMMPHLGVLSTVHPKAAMEIFEKDCLVRLGTCIAPKGQVTGGDESKEVLSVKVELADGVILEEQYSYGNINKMPLKEYVIAKATIKPAKGFDVGAGPGHELNTILEGGVVGIIIDTRGRPLTIPTDKQELKEKLFTWFQALDAYPSQIYGEQ
jgi:uncharacterized protein (TIGR01319 family)